MRYIVDSCAMKLIEERSLQQGGTVEELMDHLSNYLADYITELSPTAVVILAGKGNNGADAYSTGTRLLGRKIPCYAIQVSEPRENSLLKLRQKQFMARGGTVTSYEDLQSLPPEALILDGIYGVGFRGAPDSQATKAILFANAHGGPIVSIDVPSGIDPSTGETPGEAILADYTVACHYPKQGCFLGNGFEHCGEIHCATLPLQEQITEMALIEEHDLVNMLPRLQRCQDKHKAGMVVGVSGSPGMMGSVALATRAAFAVGAGYVRLLLPEAVRSEIPELPLEAVKTVLPEDIHLWIEFLKRANSTFVGPGLGRDPSIDERLRALWPHYTMPTVIDADALNYLATLPMNQWQIGDKILTPHLREASRLMQRTLAPIDMSSLNLLHTASTTTQGIIVLKGAPTFIISPQRPIIVMPFGNPGMATAGSGDVLTGMIAGLLASKLPPLSAAILGTSLHGLAGEVAARLHTSYSMTASSIIKAIPEALQKIISLASVNQPRSYMPYGRSTQHRKQTGL